MVFGIFTGLFRVEDQASSRLKQITAAGSSTVSMFSQMHTRLRTLSRSLQASVEQSGLVGTEYGKVAKSFTEMTTNGTVSAQAIQNLAQRMQLLSQTLTGARGTRQRLRNTSKELLIFAGRAKFVTEEINNTRRGMGMMSDLSLSAQDNMRKLASASQGAMLGMSLLQRNIMGLAFSLIFLQFSGIVRLSFLVAGLVTVLGGAALGVRSLVRRGFELINLRDVFSVLTGNVAGLNDMLLLSRKISSTLGVSVTRDLIKLSTAAQKLGIRLPEEDLVAFAKLIALNDANILNFNGSTENLIKHFLDLKDNGKSLNDIISNLLPKTGNLDETFNRLQETELGKRLEAERKIMEEFSEEWDKLSVKFGSFISKVKVGLAELGLNILNFLGNDKDGNLGRLSSSFTVLLENSEPLLVPLGKLAKITFNSFVTSLTGLIDVINLLKIPQILTGLLNIFTDISSFSFINTRGSFSEMIRGINLHSVPDILSAIESVFKNIDTYASNSTKSIRTFISKLRELNDLRNLNQNDTDGVSSPGTPEGDISFLEKVGNFLNSIIFPVPTNQPGSIDRIFRDLFGVSEDEAVLQVGESLEKAMVEPFIEKTDFIALDLLDEFQSKFVAKFAGFKNVVEVLTDDLGNNMRTSIDNALNDILNALLNAAREIQSMVDSVRVPRIIGHSRHSFSRPLASGGFSRETFTLPIVGLTPLGAGSVVSTRGIEGTLNSVNNRLNSGQNVTIDIHGNNINGVEGVDQVGERISRILGDINKNTVHFNTSAFTPSVV